MKLLLSGILFFVGGAFIAITFKDGIVWFANGAIFADAPNSVLFGGIVTLIIGKVLFVFGCIDISLNWAENVAREMKK